MTDRSAATAQNRPICAYSAQDTTDEALEARARLPLRDRIRAVTDDAPAIAS